MTVKNPEQLNLKRIHGNKEYSQLPQDLGTVITSQPTFNDNTEEIELKALGENSSDTSLSTEVIRFPPISAALQTMTGFGSDAETLTGEKLQNALKNHVRLNNAQEINYSKSTILKGISNTTEIDYQAREGNTPLMLAVATQDPEIVKAALDRKPRLKLTNHLGRTAIHEAVCWDTNEILLLLLSSNNNICSIFGRSRTSLIDVSDKNGLTPLLLCVINDKSAMAQTLLDHGANPAHKDANARAALHYAAMHGAEGCCEILLKDRRVLTGDTDEQLNGNHQQKRTALHYACLYGHTGIVRQIIKSEKFDSEAELNQQDADGFTPMAMAVIGRSYSCMEDLLEEKNVELDIYDNKGRSLLALVCTTSPLGQEDDRQTINIAKKLFEFNVRLEGIQVKDGDTTCLHLAAQTNNIELFKWLSKEVYKETVLPLQMVNSDGYTVHHFACKNGARKIIEFLLDNEITGFNRPDKTGKLPLHFACALRDLNKEDSNSIIKNLLEKTENPNHKSNDGSTALKTGCCLSLKSSVIELLKNQKVKGGIALPDNQGFIPVHYVIDNIIKGNGDRDVNLEILEELHKSGADLNIVYPNGMKPLVRVCSELPNPLEVMKRLLNLGADPSQSNELSNELIEDHPESNDFNSLHGLLKSAVIQDDFQRLSAIKLLIEKGANPHQPSLTYSNYTPLQMASETNQEQAITMLQLKPPSREDLEHRTSQGLQVAQLAVGHGFYGLKNYLNLSLAKLPSE